MRDQPIMDPRAKARIIDEIYPRTGAVDDCNQAALKRCGAGGLSPDSPKLPHIHVALKQLEDATAAVESAWNMLRSRLEPVMFDGPDDSSAGKDSRTRQSLNSGLARQIDGIAARVELLGAAISEVERKLEL